MTDLQTLLQPVSDAAPCGDDLTYDAEFLALETAAAGKPEQQFGDTLIAAEPPDWRDVESRCTALFKRTKDLRVAGLLCRAWINQRGPEGLADGLELLAQLLESHWSSVHPLPEDDDHFMRMNALGQINDNVGFLTELRQAELLRLPVGPILVRDALSVLRGQAVEGGTKVSADQLRVAGSEAWRQGHPALKAVGEARDALRRIEAACNDHLQGQQRPEFTHVQPLLDLLAELQPREGSTQSAAAGEATAASADGVAAGGVGAPSGPGVLRTRDDAVQQLLAVADFLERTEPTNPAPLLVRRAARLMTLNFMDILRELAPDSVSAVQNITGAPPSDM